MDIVIALALWIIAVAMVLGRPLKIEINYPHYQQKSQPVVDNIMNNQTKIDDEDVPQSMDAVLATINSFMGVDVNDETDRT